WKHTVDELHYGSLGALGGLWSKLLYFVLGLCLCLVVLAGPMLAALRARASKRTPPRNWASALGVLVIFHFSGTSTMTARLALGPLPADGSAPFGLLSPPSRVEAPVKAVAGFILLMIAIACAGWIWVLWRAILLPRRE
ncbi:unnamed protein product, partial [Laminaria digitata]